MNDLIIDTLIRGWVFVPIIVITFLFGILRYYLSIILTFQKNIEIQQLQDGQVIFKSRLLRENCRFIITKSFLMRKRFFNNEENGYFTQASAPVTRNVLNNLNLLNDMFKENLINVLPMIIVGGWINWIFSGFITTRVPFPLALSFKTMLQRDIELKHLDSSWVSSASWYFLNVFGLQSVYSLVLGENNKTDQTKETQEQISRIAMSLLSNLKVIFKVEWETLEIIDHQWYLKNIENEIITQL